MQDNSYENPYIKEQLIPIKDESSYSTIKTATTDPNFRLNSAPFPIRE